MLIREFITNLFLFYAPSGSDKEKQAKFETYVDIIGEKVYKRYKNFDYAKLLKYLEIKNERFPSIEKVIEALPYGVVPAEETYSGREGEVIKRVINGHEYKFTVVPNHWGERVKTIKELDAEIAERERRA